MDSKSVATWTCSGALVTSRPGVWFRSPTLGLPARRWIGALHRGRKLRRMLVEVLHRVVQRVELVLNRLVRYQRAGVTKLEVAGHRGTVVDLSARVEDDPRAR